MIEIWSGILWSCFFYFFDFEYLLTSRLQIIKALNLYREKTGSDNFFWVRDDVD